jgi:hypothetical protein
MAFCPFNGLCPLIIVVDSGYAVDPGVYRAPDQPRNPDQPRYPEPFPAWHHRRREVAVPDLTLVADRPAACGDVGGSVDPRIMAALLRLPARQRQVVALRLFLDLDTAGIGWGAGHRVGRSAAT